MESMANPSSSISVTGLTVSQPKVCIVLVLTVPVGLQTLGCIQRTPSPVPLSERAPADLTDEEKSAELARIRVRKEL